MYNFVNLKHDINTLCSCLKCRFRNGIKFTVTPMTCSLVNTSERQQDATHEWTTFQQITFVIHRPTTSIMKVKNLTQQPKQSVNSNEQNQN